MPGRWRKPLSRALCCLAANAAAAVVPWVTPSPAWPHAATEPPKISPSGSMATCYKQTNLSADLSDLFVLGLQDRNEPGRHCGDAPSPSHLPTYEAASCGLERWGTAVAARGQGRRLASGFPAGQCHGFPRARAPTCPAGGLSAGPAPTSHRGHLGARQGPGSGAALRARRDLAWLRVLPEGGTGLGRVQEGRSREWLPYGETKKPGMQFGGEKAACGGNMRTGKAAKAASETCSNGFNTAICLHPGGSLELAVSAGSKPSSC